MESLVVRLRARLSNPETVIDRPGWEDPKILPPVSEEVLAKSEETLGFTLPNTLRAIYRQVANGGIGPSFGLLGITGGHTDDQRKNAVDLYLAYRSWNDQDHEEDENLPDGEEDGDLPDDEGDWHWPERMLPICYHGCTIYECLDCSLTDPPVSVVDLSDHDWDQPFKQTSPSLAAWFETWLKECDFIEPHWLKHLDDGHDFQTVKHAGFSVFPMRAAQMPFITRLKNLEVLCLSGCPISDDTLAYLRELTKLRSLRLRSARKLSGTGLAHIVSLANLEDLDLAETQVNDAALAYLTKLPLQKLNLACTKVTGAGLKHLHELKSLKHLDLSRLPISERALAALEAALPECDVIW